MPQARLSKTSFNLIVRTTRALAAFAALLAFQLPAVLPAMAGDPPVPEPSELMALVRTTVLAADQGNKSGDYSDLAKLGTADFQKANSPDQLKERFAKLRGTGIDLKNVATMVPQTSRAPTLDINGLLRILGYFEFPTQQVVYDLVYSYDEPGKAWRLVGVLIQPRALPPQPELMQPQ